MRQETDCCVKYCLFYFNGVIWLIGLGVLAVGLWALTEKGFFDHVSEVSALSFDPVVLLITIAIITILISFMGIVGSLRENVTMLNYFAICLTGIFVVEFIFGVLGFAYRNWFFTKFNTFLNKTIKNYRKDPDLQNLIDFTQEYLECCGAAVGPDDWNNNIYFNCSSQIFLNEMYYTPTEACGVPYSCCIRGVSFVRNSQCGYGIRDESISTLERSQVIYSQSCLQRFEDWLKLNLYSVAGAFIGLALIQIIPLILAQNMKEQIMQVKKSWEAMETQGDVEDGKEVEKVDEKARLKTKTKFSLFNNRNKVAPKPAETSALTEDSRKRLDSIPDGVYGSETSRHQSGPKVMNFSDDADEKFEYDNKAIDNDETQPKVLVNGIAPGAVVNARSVGTKWNHLVKKRRLDRQFSGRASDFKISSNVTGLEEDIRDDVKQARLNKQLISHFVELARKNENDDEVNLDLIHDLVVKGADINCRDKHGQGMLHEAARAWHTDVVAFFLQNGADINMADKLERTPLHVAAAVDYPEMVQFLVENGAKIEATTYERQTPLHFAARNDATESLKILWKLGAELEAKDYKQRTPMFVAAELDRSETAKLLIELNADVTVVDSSGQMCMTHMITKMGPVARAALDQYHKKDRANRKQYFFLDLLDVPLIAIGREGKEKRSLAKTPLEVIVTYRQLDLIMHPVIMRLIDVKWDRFGRNMAIRTLLFNLIVVLTWTILGVGYPWYLRPVYIFPQDVWRVLLWILGCLFAGYEVLNEINEITRSRKKFRKWKIWREKQIEEDMRYCHPKWPEEKKYLEREKETLDDALPSYFQDFWNYFDWVAYFSVILVVVLHIADVSLTVRAPPCCTVDFVCNDSSPTVCQTGVVNNENLSVWSNRFFVLLIIFLWLRLMKFTRAFRFFGPFIVMLGKLTTDVLRFLYLYLEFYIPYSCAFWMIFGDISTIPSMRTVDQMLFSLFRITLVDDYQFQEMQTYDVVMAYILIGTFLGISAILCLNLFIALLSDTFQRVYDNANANAVMQQASLLLNFEDYLSKHKKKKVRRYIHEKCNPEILYYDDDLTVAQDADLKKVTIQIKEQMDELLEFVHKAEAEKSHEELEERGNFDENALSSRRKLPNPDDDASPRGGKIKPKSTSKFNEILGLAKAANSQKEAFTSNTSGPSNKNKIADLTDRIQRMQISQTIQEQSNKKLRDDVKEIKEMLSRLLPGGGPKPPKRGSLSLFPPPDMSLSSVPEEATKRSESQRSGQRSNFFKKLLPTSKPGKNGSQSNEIVPLPHFVPPPVKSSAPTTTLIGNEPIIVIDESVRPRSNTPVHPTEDPTKDPTINATVSPLDSSNV